MIKSGNKKSRIMAMLTSEKTGVISLLVVAIIFPLAMFKNFHVQLDVEKRVISFYSNDTNILEIKEKAFLDPKDNNTDGFYTWLIIFIISGILLILGCIYYFFYYKKKYLNFEKFNKYSKYEDEETILS